MRLSHADCSARGVEALVVWQFNLGVPELLQPKRRVRLRHVCPRTRQALCRMRAAKSSVPWWSQAIGIKQRAEGKDGNAVAAAA